jgi:homopolymeric O-antigen transport system ATP-binding protein
MNNDVLIRVEKVSKKFCSRFKRSLWYGVQDVIGDIIGIDSSTQGLRRDEFWAVDEVSFELRRGECLGLIGRNGAGKTTLLKMLNGLIKPDRGRIELRGRVGALISLGHGFNPILTGRENIYINGAVLGLSRKEIDDKINDIIEFAGIGDFIDAPVQSYSSGMHVRLGFAVATALQPDVLLLDEVLAVGDANFQAKCYQRIGHVLENAAVILVSHYPYHIQKNCNEAMLLQHGRATDFGPPDRVLTIYSDIAIEMAPSPFSILGDGVRSAEIVEATKRLEHGGKLEFTLILNLQHPIQCDQAHLNVLDQSENVHAQVFFDHLIRTFEKGRNEIHITIGPLYLSRGKYHASIVLSTSAGKKTLVHLRNCFSFEGDGPMRLGAAFYFPPYQIELR